MDQTLIKNSIEAILFVAGQPISKKRLKEVFSEEASAKEIDNVLELLKEEWASRPGSIDLIEAGGGFRFRTRKEYAEYIKKAFTPRPRSLTAAALEGLTIVAYRQPIVRTDIDKLRGVDSGGVLKSLMDKDLIKIVGRSDDPGQPMLYATTPQFLELFGINSLSELPPLKDVEDIKQQLITQDGEMDDDLAKFIAEEKPDISQLGNVDDNSALVDLEHKLKDVRKIEKEIFPPEKETETEPELESETEQREESDDASSKVEEPSKDCEADS